MAFPRPLPRQLCGLNANRFLQVDGVDLSLSSRRQRAESFCRRARSKVEEDRDVVASSSSSSSPTTTTTSSTSTRRETLLAAAVPLLSLSLSLPSPPPAHASTVPALDGVWSSLTGAPPDLFFPAASFLGEFDAVSTLVSAEAPLGEAVLPPASLAGLRRAREEDLNRPLRYRTRFIEAPRGNPAAPPGAVVFDRAFNTLSLLKATSPEAARGARVEWNVEDPNQLTLKFDAEEQEEEEEEEEEARGNGGVPPRRRRRSRRGAVRIRVTKRSEQTVADDRIDTSEFVQTIFLNDGTGEGGIGGGGGGGGGVGGTGGGVPRVKGSQVFSKWRWRAAAPPEQDGGGGGGGGGDGEGRDGVVGGPTVVATQVVSEFLSVEAGGERAYLESAGKPVAVYTYRLALTRV